MKTKFTWFLATLALAPFIGAAEPSQPACCAADKPACCANEHPTPTASAPLSTRSLYQLDATWTNDAGAPMALRSFRGQPVVIAMFFAQCEHACPLLVTDMLRLRDALPAAVRGKTRFVLVTFDTTRDTPAALKAYRTRMNLDSAWTLLRGELANVQELAMLLGVKYQQDAKGQFSHSNLITVLNPEGEIAFQRSGLQGDMLEAARAVTLATK